LGGSELRPPPRSTWTLCAPASGAVFHNPTTSIRQHATCFKLGIDGWPGVLQRVRIMPAVPGTPQPSLWRAGCPPTMVAGAG